MRKLVKNDSPVSVVKYRAQFHHEKPAKRNAKRTISSKIPMKITTACNDKSKTPSDDLRLWKYFRH